MVRVPHLAGNSLCHYGLLIAAGFMNGYSIANAMDSGLEIANSGEATEWPVDRGYFTKVRVGANKTTRMAANAQL